MTQKEMNEKNSRNESAINDAIIIDINNSISGLDYGAVMIKVHNSKIVQVEITRKKRFDDSRQFEKGGGI